ncbi:MAG: GyrI-like domain-containing protein [Legionellaceae bacterium]|nr:GyrI-like domain-containing protein [Legionellaceae bacterium]
MKKEWLEVSEMKLVGMSIRTNNTLEMNPSTGKIGPLVGEFFAKGMANSIPNRKTPGVTLCCYTDYDSDENGDYLYFVGEAVTSFDDVPEQFKTVIIPTAKYLKLTTEEGPMPNVVFSAWQDIWKMTPSDLGGERAYQVDFEVYDQRSLDPAKTVMDIYIGLR